MDTSRRRDGRAARRDRSKARGRSRGEIPDKVFRLDASGGMKPRGASGARRAHTAAFVRGLPSRGETQESRPGGPACRFGDREQRREKRQVGAPGRKRTGTSREEKAPKGEPQECCRHETRPTRLRGEQTVERVIKP